MNDPVELSVDLYEKLVLAISPRIEQVIGIGIQLEKPMPNCGLLWEELKSSIPSASLIKQSQVEVNHLECYVRNLRIDCDDSDDPALFEQVADELAGVYYSLDGLSLFIATLDELEATKPTTPKKSRMKSDKPITKWYRVHGHKYAKKAEAVRAYLELNDKDVQRWESKYYADLNNDLNKDKKR